MTSSPSQNPSDMKSISEDTDLPLNESGVTKLSPSATTSDIPQFGWSGYAERINGRFAMIWFMSILIVEALTHDAFLHWAGFIP